MSIHVPVDDLVSDLARPKIDFPLDPALFDDELSFAYDAASAARLWSVLRRSLGSAPLSGRDRGQTSPVQLRPTTPT